MIYINTLLNIIIFIGAFLFGVYLNKKTSIQEKTTKLIDKLTKKNKAIIISPSKIVKSKTFLNAFKRNKDI